MKRVFCPKCDNQLAFDETKYPEGKVLAFVCPQCGSQFKIKLGRKIVRTESGQEKAVFDYYLKNKQAIEALKAPVFEEKIVDYVIGKSNVSEKIVSIEELYSFDEDKKAGKKTTAKKSAKKSA